MGNLYHLNFRHLRAAVAVADHGSVNRASREIHLSQPALTQGIARLEDQIDQRLFERHPDGMRPTAAGELLCERVRTATSVLALAMRSVRRTAAGGFSKADQLLTMGQIRSLVALAREGSYVAAGRAVGISQAALHRDVRDIERLSGVSLVERRGRGVALTLAGMRVARSFRVAISELSAGLDEIAALQGVSSGRLAIGAMPLARARLLPAAIGRFHRENPAIRIEIAEGSYAELIEPLRDGELDLLVGALRDPSPGADLDQRPLFSDRLAIIGRAGHPLAGRSDVTLGALAALPWLVARTGTPLRTHWEKLFSESRRSLPESRIECGSVMMLRGLLLEGDFLTLLSPDQVAAEIRAGVLAVIGTPLATQVRTIGFTTRAAWRPTAMHRRFITLLSEISAGR